MTDAETTLLLVEDDSEIREMVIELLAAESWRVLGAANAVEMDAIFEIEQPDLIILDLNLPGEDGLSICKRLSSDSDIAILMLTARSDDVDRIVGLEIGADDYLGKPFNPRELVARVRALLRRRQRTEVSANGGTVEAGPYIIDFAAHQVFHKDGREIKLSTAEFELLKLLVEAKGRVLSREYLLENIHGRNAEPFDRAIDVLVSRLRKKIDNGPTSLIEAVRNAGYVVRGSRS